MEENKEVKDKPSYEELTEKVAGLEGLNQQLIMRLQSENLGNLFKRLDYLFKVVENKEAFDTDFVAECTKEIKEFMTPMQKPDETVSETDKQ